MLLLIHIIIALTGLVISGMSSLAPSINKIRASKSLVALTLATGTILTLQTHSSLASVCVAGLTYTLISSAMILVAQRRLASS